MNDVMVTEAKRSELIGMLDKQVNQTCVSQSTVVVNGIQERCSDGPVGCGTSMGQSSLRNYPNTGKQRGVQPQTADTRRDGSMFISKDPNI